MTDIFETIYSENRWKSKESRSGPGSTLKATSFLRENILDLLEAYDVQTMLDIPCGDFHWMSELTPLPGYIGADVVPAMIKRNKLEYPGVDFRVLDAAKDELPAVDLIFCRELLQHLSIEKAKAVLANFVRSDAKFLLITTHDVRRPSPRKDIEDGGYRPLDLLQPPFSLPWPSVFLKDVGVKLMFFYHLEDLR